MAFLWTTITIVIIFHLFIIVEQCKYSKSTFKSITNKQQVTFKSITNKQQVTFNTHDIYTMSTSTLHPLSPRLYIVSTTW